eukprot:TRINITY_DN1189_c0_g1_i2.p1 TRINITY_DN1189_c0_g1~~TRINITY_DN1189_c0_g1_i2.p1  ORF type:complete len:275 (-),score=59.83 TRINITY_DN1189_c0_g1_i2:74-898(-)
MASDGEASGLRRVPTPGTSEGADDEDEMVMTAETRAGSKLKMEVVSDSAAEHDTLLMHKCYNRGLKRGCCRAALIRLSIREPKELFESFDAPPFSEAPMNEEAADYLIRSIRMIWVCRPAQIIVLMPKMQLETEEAQMLPDAIRKHFKYKACLLKYEMRHNFSRGLYGLLVALCVAACILVFAAVVMYLMKDQESWFSVLIVGTISIIGWVSLWGPVEKLIHTSRELFYDYRKWLGLSVVPFCTCLTPCSKKLSRTKVQLVAAEDDPYNKQDHK